MNKSRFKAAMCTAALLIMPLIASSKPRVPKMPKKEVLAEPAILVQYCERKAKLKIGDTVSEGRHKLIVSKIEGEDAIISAVLSVNPVPAFNIITYDFTLHGLKVRKNDAQIRFCGLEGPMSADSVVDKKELSVSMRVTSVVQNEVNKAFIVYGRDDHFSTDEPLRAVLKETETVEERENEIVLKNRKGENFILDRTVAINAETGFMTLPNGKYVSRISLRMKLKTGKGGIGFEGELDCANSSPVRMRLGGERYKIESTALEACGKKDEK